MNLKILRITIQRNRIWPIILELYGISSSILGFLDYSQCSLQATVVISRQLCITYGGEANAMPRPAIFILGNLFDMN